MVKFYWIYNGRREVVRVIHIGIEPETAMSYGGISAVIATSDGKIHVISVEGLETDPFDPETGK